MAPPSDIDVLYVEDDEPLRDLAVMALGSRGVVARGVGSIDAALQVVSERPPRLLVLDRQLPDGDGSRALDELRAAAPEGAEFRILLTTAAMEEAELMDLLVADLDDFLQKPFTPAGFVDRCEKLLAFDKPDTRVGPYRILRPLGRGGMGIVFLAERDGEQVALKLMRRELCVEERMVERFRREAIALQRLAHPNIIRYLDAGRADGRLYIVTEYAEGDTLDGHIVSERVAAQYGRRVLDALMAVHRAGFVHRDVKPANVVIRNDGEVKLLDLGVVYSPQSSDRLTAVGIAIGSPRFASPEQLLGRPVPESDLYAFGVTLYEMVTGELAFFGTPAGRPMIDAKRSQRRGISPREHTPELSEAFDELVRGLTSPSIGDRPTPERIGATLDAIIHM